MSSTIKFCKNCQYIREGVLRVEARCAMTPIGPPDPVYGTQVLQFCAVVRQLGGSCGPEAKLFRHD